MIALFRSKQYFRDLVQTAYEQENSSAHTKIKKWFMRWFGLDDSMLPNVLLRKSVHEVLKASRYLAATTKARSLGFNKIGVDDLKIESLTSDANTASVYLFGASDNMRFFKIYKSLLHEGDTAIDVGANVGIHCCVMAHYCGQSGHVLAFEPSPSIYARLKKNIAFNQLSQIQLNQVALSCHEGEIGFDDKSNETNIGKSKIDHNSEYKVPVTSLDKLAAGKDNISLIKIDVEGFEIDVLKGAQETLLKHKPALVIEVNVGQYSLGDILQAIPYPVNVFHIIHNMKKDYHPLTRDEYRSIVAHKKIFDALILPQEN